ncbi:uncharacterized protein KQ657_000482 [Scheffersomyces spartinae]|uniref:Bicarbonate transporter-like transmembrane domain-containing protein n=1 Tax=Scheffersomyces spartinae TaxID=45513 RepID=A0A9P7V9P2_9ASCO|nr:uncharacterized protein KQ657_000482 [Scheffersomyces spartinae]KAG7193789.1 hypothetical protein KQ657_000482 [Scheffersomyces spartinae]
MQYFLRLSRKVGLGIYTDVTSRIPYYAQDFKDAWNYRVIPLTIFVFFTNLLPAIAFAQDMFDRTNNAYGVNEILFSSALAGVVFGLFLGQPLCIVGVTGPIAIFSYTVYDLIKDRGTPYFPFMCWIYLWSMIMHLVMALLNWVSYLSFITNFSCDVFGFFINFVYLQKGVQILSRQFEHSVAGGFCSVMLSILMVVFGVGSQVFGSQLHYFNHHVRKVFVDYGVPMSVIFFSGFMHFGGYLNNVDLQRLPITTAFEPTAGKDPLVRPHGWFIHFWPNTNISWGDVFLAIPFGVLLTILFYFDHNVLSLMCQAKRYPLKKPSSFHYDFALLGITTGIAGLLGFPAPNGLIPQAPLHTESLLVHDRHGRVKEVVEQRLTNTLQGVATFIFMTKPFLHVLGLIPQAILAGLFFTMGINGLDSNIVVDRIRFHFLDPRYIELDSCPVKFKQMAQIGSKKWPMVYTVLQVIAGMCEFVITLTKAAIGFPAVLIFYAICAKWVWPKFIPKEYLTQLDGEVADEVIIRNLQLIRDDDTQSDLEDGDASQKEE